MATYNYEEIAPILKENPDMSWEKFTTLHPEFNLTNWSFHARKAKLKGLSTYGQGRKKAPKSKSSTKIKKIRKKSIDEDIQVIVDDLMPQSSLKQEFVLVAKELLKNPETPHSTLKDSGLITMSDCSYYSFRRKFTKRLNLNGFSKPATTKTNGSSSSVRKKNVLYRTVYEKEVGKNLNPKALDLLKDFVGHLNNEKIIPLEIVEVVDPKHCIEIRTYSR